MKSYIPIKSYITLTKKIFSLKVFEILQKSCSATYGPYRIVAVFYQSLDFGLHIIKSYLQIKCTFGKPKDTFCLRDIQEM